MTIQPFYIIPILIKQPTWGGTYIQQLKQLRFAQLESEKIGQSYELSAESRISADPAAQDSCYVMDSSMGSSQQYGPVTSTIDLQSLLSVDPKAVLGNIPQLGTSTMPLLIKFTQAQSNSFQVHVKPGAEFHGWQAKPESWYFLEEGRATLGLKPGTQIAQYKQSCLEIDAFSRELSNQVKNEMLGLHTAREQLAAFIAERDPHNYVNLVSIPRGSVVDLSEGGIHHSWENNDELSQGNIVFEVQLDVKDERSTIRSFDQGNMKESGDIRPLHIEDYFQAINTSPLDNRPDRLIRQPQGRTEQGIKHTNLFDTDYYLTTSVETVGPASQAVSIRSFQHIFAQQGDLRVEWRDLTFDLKEGRSLFIPAACEQYLLSTADSTTALLTSAVATSNMSIS